MFTFRSIRNADREQERKRSTVELHGPERPNKMSFVMSAPALRLLRFSDISRAFNQKAKCKTATNRVNVVSALPTKAENNVRAQPSSKKQFQVAKETRRGR
jgi:hypothetical protein